MWTPFSSFIVIILSDSKPVLLLLLLVVLLLLLVNYVILSGTVALNAVNLSLILPTN